MTTITISLAEVQGLVGREQQLQATLLAAGLADS